MKHRKSKSFTITIKVDPLKIVRGHQPHRSGAGKHLDGRYRRNRTRSAQIRNALQE